MKPLTEQDWITTVKPGSRVFIGSGAACPHALIGHMLEQYPSFQDIELVHILTLGDCPWATAKYERNIRTNSFFLGPQVRDSVNQGRADYTPCFLFEIPRLFTSGTVPLDVALIQVSPPDDSGNCTLGVSVDVVAAACRSASIIIAQVNPKMPRTYGETVLPVERIDYFLEKEEDLLEVKFNPPDDTTQQIGRYVAQLVDDGSTLQVGIGQIPNAVCAALKHHNDLGMHSEMLGDGAMELMKTGVINNKQRSLSPGISTVSFAMGSQALYDFVHENTGIEFYPSEHTNNPVNIALNPQMVAINSGLQVDLTGQVVADSIGHEFYSGIGGQVDFIRGAALSPEGKAIIALPSTALSGTVSRIVPNLEEGAGVVTSRGDVQFVVTEFGIATLRGRTIRERALELIQIAHPDFREKLLDCVRQRHWVPAYQHDTPKPMHDIAGMESKKLEREGETYILRALHPSDERSLQEFFYSHTRSTIHMRYGYEIKDMDRERAYRLVNVDQEQDLALAVLQTQGPRQVIHAVGRYYLDPTENSAEFAFVVSEEKRRHGLASALFAEMIHIAKKRCLKSLWGIISRDNQPMQELVRKMGGKIVGIDNESIVEGRIALEVAAGN